MNAIFKVVNKSSADIGDGGFVQPQTHDGHPKELYSSITSSYERVHSEGVSSLADVTSDKEVASSH